jgi:hypothetical protein
MATYTVNNDLSSSVKTDKNIYLSCYQIADKKLSTEIIVITVIGSVITCFSGMIGSLSVLVF